jgi:hypothetical protein
MATLPATHPAWVAYAFVCLVGCERHQLGATSGDPAPLFSTVDENGQTVQMRELIRGRPLVLAVGSAS